MDILELPASEYADGQLRCQKHRGWFTPSTPIDAEGNLGLVKCEHESLVPIADGEMVKEEDIIKHADERSDVFPYEPFSWKYFKKEKCGWEANVKILPDTSEPAEGGNINLSVAEEIKASTHMV